MKLLMFLKILTSFVMMNTNKCQKMVNGNNGKCIRLAHQNLGGGKIYNKLVDIDFIKHSHDPDVLGVSESRLDEFTVDQMKVRGFKTETKDDSNRINVFVKNSISYKRRKDLEIEFFPVIWIQLGQGKQKMLVANIYREWQIPKKLNQPNSTLRISDQLARFRKFVESWKNVIENENAEVHVMGDVNLDCNHWTQLGHKGKEWQPLVDLLFKEIISRGFVQTVRETTRSQAGHDSILDHHYTNSPVHVKSTIVEHISNSDHCYVQVNRTNRKFYTADPQVKARNWSKIDWSYAEFCLKLAEIDGEIDPIYFTRDVDDVTARITALVKAVLDVQAPTKPQPNKKNKCPYIDSELSKLIRQKAQIYKKYKKIKSKENWNNFKIIRNKVAHLQKKKKQEFIKERVKEGVSSKPLWDFSKSLLGWNKKQGINEIEINGTLTKDKSKQAAGFNEFFLKKIQTIDEKIPPTDKDPLEYTKKYLEKFKENGNEIPEFKLKRITTKDIKKIIGKLNCTKSSGFDEISMYAVKKLRHVLAKWLKRILILSFETGKYPSLWKTAKIMPVHKGGEEHLMKQYRPVALLPVFSKVIEKAMVNQLTDHFEKIREVKGPNPRRKYFSRLLSFRQHGYRARMSCGTNILQLIEDILIDAEKGSDNALLMMDLSAAFDTIDRNLLLKKLKLYGVGEQALKWFKSYMEDRWQFVELNGQKSKKEQVKIGCFQGSTRAMLLFIIYINDLVVL